MDDASPLRILTVVKDLGPRGTPRSAQNFSLAYRRAGHEVAVLAHLGDGPRRRTLACHGIPVFAGSAGLDEALTAADRFEPDVIHIHRTGKPDQREGSILRRLRRPGRIVLERSSFGRVDYSSDADLIDVHCQISAFCLWRWRRWLGRRYGEQIGVLIRNPVETSGLRRGSPTDRAAQRAAWGVPDEAFVCGHVGFKLSRWVFDGFGRLARADPSAWLVCVNFDPAMRLHVDSLPAAIRQRILILDGAQDDGELARLYSAFDCLLHAAVIGETFGHVLAEAILCGVPVASLSRPHRDNGHVELIGHRLGGLIAGCPERFPDAVVELRRDDELRASAAASGPARIEELCAADTMAERALRVARLALEHRDRRDLRAALNGEPNLETSVDDMSIKRVLENTLGGPSRRDLALMRIVQSYRGQRMVRFFRRAVMGQS